MHIEDGEEGRALSLTSKATSLQFSSLATRGRFHQFKFHFQSLITGIVCGNGLTYPSMPKR